MATAVALIAEAYFANGVSALRDAISQCGAWAVPSVPGPLELTLFSYPLLLDLVTSTAGAACAVPCARSDWAALGVGEAHGEHRRTLNRIE